MIWHNEVFWRRGWSTASGRLTQSGYVIAGLLELHRSTDGLRPSRYVVGIALKLNGLDHLSLPAEEVAPRGHVVIVTWDAINTMERERVERRKVRRVVVTPLRDFQ
jgi:hypothetical protein